jgi:NTE family protein
VLRSSAIAVGSLVLAIVQGGAWGWTSARVLGAGAAGVLLSLVFARRCLTRPDPLVDLRMFANRSCGAANAATLVCAAGFFGFTLVNVLFLTDVWHYSVLRAGLAITPAALIVAVVAGPSSRLVARFGERAVAVTGTLICRRRGLAGDLWRPAAGLPGAGCSASFSPVSAEDCFPTLSSAAITSAAGQTSAPRPRSTRSPASSGPRSALRSPSPRSARR